MKFEIAISKSNFGWHFSSSDCSISSTHKGTWPHLKYKLWDKSECFSAFNCWDLSWMRQGFWIRFWIMRSLFCSTSGVAGWCLLKKITRYESLLYLWIFEKAFEKAKETSTQQLFCKSCDITHHSLLKVKFKTGTLLEMCRRCWLKN